MKIFRIVFLFFAMLLALPKANAQYQGFIVGFEIVGSSHLVVNQQASSTTFKVNISVNRTLNGSTFYPFRMNFKLGIENGELFPTVYTITDADFTAGQIRTSKEFSATIANSKLPDGRKLQAYYNNPSNNNPNYTNSNLLVTIFNPPPVTTPTITITNNSISLYNNGGNNIGIIGTTPVVSSGHKYAFTYQRKNSNGVFEDVNNTMLSGKEINGGSLYGILAHASGGVYRRRVGIAVSGVVSYSNELTVPATQSTTIFNSYTVTKTEVFDSNGILIGNNVKISLSDPDPNIRFSALLLGPDDPYYLPVNQNYEFFFPAYYNNDSVNYSEKNFAVVLSTNAVNISNSPSSIIPTWR